MKHEDNISDMVRQNLGSSILFWDLNFPFGLMSVHQVKQDSQKSFRTILEEIHYFQYLQRKTYSN